MILFGCTLLFLLLLALAVPVAFSIGMASLVYFWFADVPLVVAAQQVLAGPDSWVLMALPTFVLAGMLMNSSGISARIVDFANAVVGSIRGGLAMTESLQIAASQRRPTISCCRAGVSPAVVLSPFL